MSHPVPADDRPQLILPPGVERPAPADPDGRSTRAQKALVKWAEGFKERNPAIVMALKNVTAAALIGAAGIGAYSDMRALDPQAPVINVTLNLDRNTGAMAGRASGEAINIAVQSILSRVETERLLHEQRDGETEIPLRINLDVGGGVSLEQQRNYSVLFADRLSAAGFPSVIAHTRADGLTHEPNQPVELTDVGPNREQLLSRISEATKYLTSARMVMGGLESSLTAGVIGTASARDRGEEVRRHMQIVIEVSSDDGPTDGLDDAATQGPGL